MARWRVGIARVDGITGTGEKEEGAYAKDAQETERRHQQRQEGCRSLSSSLRSFVRFCWKCTWHFAERDGDEGGGDDGEIEHVPADSLAPKCPRRQHRAPDARASHASTLHLLDIKHRVHLIAQLKLGPRNA
eukprot:2887896-Rhodomonas_salina.2